MFNLIIFNCLAFLTKSRLLLVFKPGSQSEPKFPEKSGLVSSRINSRNARPQRHNKSKNFGKIRKQGIQKSWITSGAFLTKQGNQTRYWEVLFGYQTSSPLNAIVGPGIKCGRVLIQTGSFQLPSE